MHGANIERNPGFTLYTHAWFSIEMDSDKTAD